MAASIRRPTGMNVLRKSEREFLSQNKIEYTDRNIAADETALADLEKLGYLTTPVTVVDGEVVIGFDRAKLERLLLQDE
jgi:glutaredoxin 3